MATEQVRNSKAFYCINGECFIDSDEISLLINKVRNGKDAFLIYFAKRNDEGNWRCTLNGPHVLKFVKYEELPTNFKSYILLMDG